METTSLLHDPAFWLLVLFAIPLILRVPIALALGFSALVVVWQWDLGFSMLSYNFFAGIAKFPLLAIPFFILAGYIMERSGIAARIVALMEALVGSMTGGLAVATVAVATFWGAVSGSGPATVAALGLILIPGMARAGYDKAFAAATVSVTSGLAIVIPPSIAFIVYGSVADVSVPALFAAGFVPGIVVALFIMAAVLIIYYKQVSEGYEDQARFEIMQRVGMTKRDIRTSVNAQLRMVFLLPLLAAFVHLAFAQPMIWRILRLFGLQNLPLVLGVTACACAVFTVLYCAACRLTSNAYCRIVGEGV